MPATDHQRRFTNPVGYSCSIAEADDARMAREARHGERVKRRLVRRTRRPAESFVRQDDKALPPAFVAETLAMIEVHVRVGNWRQALKTLSIRRKRWKQEQGAIANISRTFSAEKSAWHVTDLLDHRMANEIERHCNGTVGALLEIFPMGMVHIAGIGPIMIDRIAKMLVRIGVIDVEQADKAVAAWKHEMNHGGKCPRLDDMGDVK